MQDVQGNYHLVEGMLAKYRDVYAALRPDETIGCKGAQGTAHGSTAVVATGAPVDQSKLPLPKKKRTKEELLEVAKVCPP
jgi:hypothetical protein